MTTIILGTHAIAVQEHVNVAGGIPYIRESDGKGDDTITIKTTDTIEFIFDDGDIMIELPDA